jgi:hypothetical protein
MPRMKKTPKGQAKSISPQDVTEPRRGALAAASWSGSGQHAPPNTQDAIRYQTIQLSHAGLTAANRELGGGLGPRR